MSDLEKLVEAQIEIIRMLGEQIEMYKTIVAAQKRQVSVLTDTIDALKCQEMVRELPVANAWVN